MIELRDRARKRLWAGDLAGARAEYDAAITAHPGEAILYAGRAAVRDPAGAKEDVERALELDPRCADALLARARMSADPRTALADAEAALEAEPGHVPARYWRALWRAGFGEEEKAREDLRAVWQAKAEDLLSLQYRAFAAAALGEFKAARGLLDRVVDGGVAEPGVRRLRAQLRGWLRDAKGAVRDWTAVLEKKPDDVPALVERSMQHRLAGYPTEAMRDVERAIELAPGNPMPLFFRALARGGAGAKGPFFGGLNPAGAFEDLERAAKASAEDVEGFYFRGRAKEELGRRGEARMDYERARRVSPPFHWLEGELAARLKREEEAGAAPRGAERRSFRTAPLSLVLVGMNVAIWLVQGEPYLAPDIEALLGRGALTRDLVWQGEIWRLFTMMFLHIGPFHLFVNMYMAYGWCGAAERSLGSGKFLLAYVGSGLAASATSLYGHLAVTAGASGALFGVLGLVLFEMYHRLGSLKNLLAHPGVRFLLMLLGLWFVLGFTVLPMDNYAHAGGGLAGLLFGWLYLKVPAYPPPVRLAVHIFAALLLAAYTLGACIPWYA